MEDFTKKIVNGVVVEVVNLSRATYNDALQFKKILNEDINEKKFKKVVIDISRCDFVDSTFLGAMIFAKRSMNAIGGELRVVQPQSPFGAFLERTPILETLEPHESLEKAIMNFK